MKMKSVFSRNLFFTALLKSNAQQLQRKYVLSVVLGCALLALLSPAKVNAQYGINTSGALPDSSAMLDIVSTTKGLLIPRVYLSSVTDSATISHPAISLQVYNTNASIGKGFWYWSGVRWIKTIDAKGSDSLAINASISSPLLVGGSTTTSALTYKTTTANGTTGADHIFKVGNNGGTEAMRILNSGNVGIGTTTPDIFSFGGSGYKYFTVTSSTASAYGIANLVGGTSGGGKVDFGATGSLRQATIATLNGSHLVFYTNNSNSGTSVSERIRIENTGEVGIGTTNPNFKVHINHSTSVRNALNDVLALGNSCTGNGPYLGHGQGIAFYDRTYWLATDRVLSRIYSVINDHSASMAGTDLVFQTMTVDTNAGPDTKMIIRYNGRVGIGTTTPTTTLDVNGTSNFTGNMAITGNVTVTGSGTYSGTWTVSDRKFKKEIDTLNSAIGIVKQLQPKSYYFDTASFNKDNKFNLSATKQYGFIAQEIEEILPELVSNNTLPAVLDTLGNEITPAFEFKAINYTALIPILTQAIQDLEKKNEQLESAKSQQEAINLSLQNQISALAERIQQLEAK